MQWLLQNLEFIAEQCNEVEPFALPKITCFLRCLVYLVIGLVLLSLLSCYNPPAYNLWASQEISQNGNVWNLFFCLFVLTKNHWLKLESYKPFWKKFLNLWGKKLARYYLEDSKQDQGNTWIFCSGKMGTGVLSIWIRN